MRTNQRSKRDIWYALYQEISNETDEDGNRTGEHPTTYSTPVKARMNVSGGRGQAAVEEFGIDNPFTRSAVTDDLKTPFNTDTIFWFGINPVDSAGNPVAHNFRCTGVSRTINCCTIALEELDVTHEEYSNPIVSG